jgi:hypothetical protein
VKTDPILDLLLADPHVSEAFKAIFKPLSDVKREEIAEDARREAQWERRIERNRDAYDAPSGGRL